MRPGPITVRVSDEDRKTLVVGAKRHGTTRAGILRAGGLMVAGFDEYFMERLKEYCERMQMSESLVIQNIVTGWMAWRDAEIEVYRESENTLPEFAFSPLGPIPSISLYERLHRDYERQMSYQRELLEEAELLDSFEASRNPANHPWLIHS